MSCLGLCRRIVARRWPDLTAMRGFLTIINTRECATLRDFHPFRTILKPNIFCKTSTYHVEAEDTVYALRQTA